RQLALLQGEIRSHGGIDGLQQLNSDSEEGTAILVQVRGLRCRINSALWVMDVLAPCFVEADRYVVLLLAQRAKAGVAEQPRSKKPRTAWSANRVNDHGARQRSCVPPRGEKVHVMPVAGHPPREIGNVGLAAAARRVDVFVAQRDLHASAPLRLWRSY